MKPAEKQQVLELLLRLARKSIGEQEFTALFGNEPPARISEVTLALRDSKPFLQTLRNRLEAVGRVAGALELAGASRLMEWLGDDCDPCLVDRAVEGYGLLYQILLELDELLLWTGWPLLGTLHDPAAALKE
ncbi:MAG: hypothetical protein QF822_04690 [Candidatus Poseidoniia archaeon]|jgi:hypothetical protein|nr:hypothetical protein [Euryarchaeota archaeon]MDP6489896.1 hypothetical protein [Candidatus Poseidoniia archaeon]MDP6534497.1 hypothetical protein [Candidatus Poseidoniia archaeon]MDP6835493.1 hypothetical protein [Candidatus Poseidoniia archaeon]HIH79444.1 hypothetical protein [Candidatus Poseidoniia archaeon]|tara:strand:- start:516 stop:911 length:396 start_codon:yes stop_codon:yes gene_type:complete